MGIIHASQRNVLIVIELSIGRIKKSGITTKESAIVYINPTTIFLLVLNIVIYINIDRFDFGIKVL